LSQGRSSSASVSCETSDSVDTAAHFFLAFGAEVVDAKGNVVVKNEQCAAGARILQETDAFLPSDAPAWTMVPTTGGDLGKGR